MDHALKFFEVYKMIDGSKWKILPASICFFFCTIEISTPQNHASMQNDRLKSVFVEQKLGVNDT